MLRMLLFPLLSFILLMCLTGAYIVLDPDEHVFISLFSRDVLLVLTGGALVLFLFSALPIFTALYKQRSNSKPKQKR